MPLAAFPYNHCRSNGQQRESNESCCYDYHRSLENVGLAVDRNSDLLFSIHVRYRLSYGARQLANNLSQTFMAIINGQTIAMANLFFLENVSSYQKAKTIDLTSSSVLSDSDLHRLQ